jgi:hypothetical protein
MLTNGSCIKTERLFLCRRRRWDILIVLLDTTDYLIPDTLVAARMDAEEGTKALSCRTGPLRVERSLRDV